MGSDKGKILIVDDEPMIRRILSTRLTMVGYQVIVASNGIEALEKFEQESPDLVVLDVMMPQLNGLEVCQELRKVSDTPIVMLTALSDVADRIMGLQLGADDYLPKPFSPKELEERIHAILRRLKSNSAKATATDGGVGVIQAGSLRIETHKRQVFLNNERVALTGMEFDLLELLALTPGKTVSRADILQKVWGYSPRHYADMRVVDVHVSRLRSKIGDNPKSPEFIHTDWGTGYFFQGNSDSSQVVSA
ncbi:response regulator [Synechococcales cyanobacterium C]|uniref:Probable transcriptional regulator ycf27 n=1 Tax=Petrachloros mirabilis ULC683 TaxID=2781853 RepID=A0A8K2A1X9_9CYAN|nr:response regulator [Petrachloros mirabilis]NCJ07987.1 response regulator [Petrachloros mirabilis ULC683]